MDFDLNDELDKVVLDARASGLSEDEIISGFELKKMELEEAQDDD